MYAIAVKFKSYGSNVYNSKDYIYRSNVEISVGSEVVVDTSTNGLQIALVRGSSENPELLKKATKYIVQVVDMQPYRELVAKEEKRSSLKKLLDDKLESAQKMLVYETLAEKDPEFAEILSKYKELLDE